jgi:hypothetical protein
MDLPLTFFYRTPSRYPSGESTETAEISPKKLKLCVLGELSGYITTSTLKRDTIKILIIKKQLLSSKSCQNGSTFVIDSNLEQISLKIEMLVDISRAIVKTDNFRNRESSGLC